MRSRRPAPGRRGGRIMRKTAHSIARAIAAALLFLCAGSAITGSAQDASGTFVLRAARMFDATSERMRSDAVVVVQAGRIVGVGRDAAIPDGARTIDLGDATLLPGFIDVHSHLDRKSTRLNSSH